MTPAQQHITRLLHHYGKIHQVSLSLQDGVCALYEQGGQEAAVLEMPANGDALLLHGEIMRFQDDNPAATYHLMLLLNFEMAAMKGCWLALDENTTLRLCSRQTADSLDESRFTALLSAFIDQKKEVRLLINELLSPGKAA
ncbi:MULTISPECIES: type III secretion system chaperone [unclassified Brenneria]|uniref:type III secretion system chaperone n=1 Tax=unclassified Brenneria TaxID=2634434 RepID=UPI00155495DF|nr:type III secretion system chaperone [Brenneria sp. hezel4-2-4]MEE3649186.1 type III secretion system chaperone [Brenneria sp. HEZEL_4_2_4]NPC99141.1 DspFAvrF family protein [Brenneria sp. hezel4-2-4]